MYLGNWKYARDFWIGDFGAWPKSDCVFIHVKTSSGAYWDETIDGNRYRWINLLGITFSFYNQNSQGVRCKQRRHWPRSPYLIIPKFFHVIIWKEEFRLEILELLMSLVNDITAKKVVENTAKGFRRKRKVVRPLERTYIR